MTISKYCVVVGLILAGAAPAQAHSELRAIEAAVTKPSTVQAAGTQLALAAAYKRSGKTHNTANTTTQHSQPAHGRTN